MHTRPGPASVIGLLPPPRPIKSNPMIRGEPTPNLLRTILGTTRSSTAPALRKEPCIYRTACVGVNRYAVRGQPLPSFRSWNRVSQTRSVWGPETANLRYLIPLDRVREIWIEKIRDYTYLVSPTATSFHFMDGRPIRYRSKKFTRTRTGAFNQYEA